MVIATVHVEADNMQINMLCDRDEVYPVTWAKRGS